MFSDACHHGRRDHQPGAGGDRHCAVGLAVPSRRPAAVARSWRRQAAHPGVHHRGRLAASVARATWCARPRCAARPASGREDQGRQAACQRRRARLTGGARGRRRRLRDHGRRQPVLHAERGAAPRTAPMPNSASPGSRNRCAADDIIGHAAPRGGQRGADRGGRIAVLAGAVRGLRAAGCVLDRAGRCRSRRRHHAVAEGGAHGRGVQPARCARTS